MIGPRYSVFKLVVVSADTTEEFECVDSRITCFVEGQPLPVLRSGCNLDSDLLVCMLLGSSFLSFNQVSLQDDVDADAETERTMSML